MPMMQKEKQEEEMQAKLLKIYFMPSWNVYLFKIIRFAKHGYRGFYRFLFYNTYLMSTFKVLLIYLV